MSNRSIATDDADEFDMTQSSFISVMHADAPQNQLLWDDLSPEHEPSPSPYDALLKDHNVDEDFLDDEGEWTQYHKGGWCWRAFEPLMHLDIDKDEHEPSAGSDPEEFPSDSSLDLFLTPPHSQPQFSPDIIDACTRHYRQIGTESVDPDRDLNRKAKSQDYVPDIAPLNTSEHTPLPYHLEGIASNLTSSQEPPPNPIAGHQRPVSQSDSHDMGSLFDSDSNSDIIYDFDQDVPEILSGLPSADEIHSRDHEFVIRVCRTQSDSDIQAFVAGEGGEWDCDLDM